MENRIMFGTDGIRGNASSYPFTSNSLIRLGSAIGRWIKGKASNANKEILIAGDTRNSYTRIKNALTQGLAENARIIDAGVLPTPAIALLLSKSRTFHAGIVISASHNPHYDNGIKIFDAFGEKITEQDESTIIDEYYSSVLPAKIPHPSVDVWTYAQKSYEQTLYDFFSTENFTGLSVALDCANGATAQIAPTLFKKLGASVHSIATNPDGFNINNQCGALHLEQLQQCITLTKSHIGFAFDGDGDRLVAVNHNGEVKDGDDILFLLSSSQWYEAETRIVGTVMTNYGLDKALKKQGKSIIRTPVGDKYIQRAQIKENLSLGGETSGHIIMKDYLSTGDGLFTALRLLSVLQKSNNLAMKTFTKFPQVMVNIPVNHKTDLSQEPFSSLIKQYQNQLSCGRMLVRFSGTENLLRVMAEAESYDIALQAATELSSQLKTLL